MTEIALRKKQIETLEAIKAKKATLSKEYAELNDKESLILELALEEAMIEKDTVESVQLNGKVLEVKLKEITTETPPVKKAKKAKVTA